MADDIRSETNGDSGRYFISVEGASREAELTWVERGDVRHANHTFVPPEARGKGIAEQLVKAIIADAREEGFKIAPDCSYVDSYFRRHPDMAELRA